MARAAAAAQQEADLRLKAKGLGAPDALPKNALDKWCTFAAPPTTELVAYEKRVYLGEIRDEGKSAPQRVQYAVYFEPIVENGIMKLQCRMCAKTQSYMIVLPSGAAEFPFKNAYEHLKVCSGRPLLLLEDEKAKRARPAEAPLSSAAADALPSSRSVGEMARLLVISKVLDGQPLSLRMGEEDMLKGLGFETPSRRTLGRVFERMYEEMKEIPLETLIKGLWTMRYENGPDRFTLQMRGMGGFDGWSGFQLEAFESGSMRVALLMTVVKEVPIPGNALGLRSRTTSLQLRGAPVQLGLHHWKNGEGGVEGFKEEGHSIVMQGMLGQWGYGPKNLFATAMDGTAGNKSVLRLPEWSKILVASATSPDDATWSVFGITCGQHNYTNCIKDGLADANFEAAHDAAHKLAMFIRESTKRREAAEAHGVRIPPGASNTRFGQHLLVIAKVVESAAGYTSMYNDVVGGKTVFNGSAAVKECAATANQYKDLWGRVMGEMPSLELLARVQPAYDTVITALGSDSAYTSSILYDAFEHVWGDLQRERKTAQAAWDAAHAAALVVGDDVDKAVAPSKKLLDIVLVLENALLKRVCTDHQLQRFQEHYHTAPSWTVPGIERERKLLSDSFYFCCMLLDPACAILALSRCPPEWKDDFIAFLYRYVIFPAAQRDEQPEDAPVDAGNDNKKKLKDEVARIKAIPVPAGYDPAVWVESVVKKMIAAAKAKYGAPVDDGVPGGDPFMPLLNQLRKEVDEYEVYLSDEAVKRAMDPTYAPYGNPLAEGPDARYEFWPTRKGTQPLLFFCAAQLLAACGGSSCNQERVHSAAGYIYCKLRASLRPARVEMLTLARHWLRNKAAEEARGRDLEEVQLQELREREAESAREAAGV